MLASRLTISPASVARAWRAYGFKPHKAESFRFSTDPELVGKVTDVYTRLHNSRNYEQIMTSARFLLKRHDQRRGHAYSSCNIPGRHLYITDILAAR